MDMHEYEFEVEAVIDAEIDTVFNAILDVNSYHNWFPGVEIRVRGGEKILQRGSVMEVLNKSNPFITLRLKFNPPNPKPKYSSLLPSPFPHCARATS